MMDTVRSCPFRHKKENLTFSVTITKQTLYKYIYDGIFMRVTADNLAIKRKRKKLP